MKMKRPQPQRPSLTPDTVKMKRPQRPRIPAVARTLPKSDPSLRSVDPTSVVRKLESARSLRSVAPKLGKKALPKSVRSLRSVDPTSVVRKLESARSLRSVDTLLPARGKKALIGKKFPRGLTPIRAIAPKLKMKGSLLKMKESLKTRRAFGGKG